MRIHKSFPYWIAMVVGALCTILWVGTGCADSAQELENQRLREVANRNEDLRRSGQQSALRLIRRLKVDPLIAQGDQSSCRVKYGQKASAAAGLRLLACGDFEDLWPFQVKMGYLRCQATSIRALPHGVIFGTMDGTEYALNTAARAVGYTKVDHVIDGETAAARQGIRVLTRIGLELCSKG